MEPEENHRFIAEPGSEYGSNWVKINRKILGNHWWNEKPFGKGQAIIDLILCAAFAPGFYQHLNRMIHLERGEIIVSIRQLADRWGWSKSVAERFVTALENELFWEKSNARRASKKVEVGQIKTASAGQMVGQMPSVYLIVNYESYQGGNFEVGQMVGQMEVPFAGQMKPDLNLIGLINKEEYNKYNLITSFFNTSEGTNNLILFSDREKKFTITANSVGENSPPGVLGDEDLFDKFFPEEEKEAELFPQEKKEKVPAKEKEKAKILKHFQKFWDAYGKKVDRAKCEKLFSKLTEQDVKNIFSKLEDYINATPDITYRRNPETWLRNRSWENDVPKRGSRATSRHANSRAEEVASDDSINDLARRLGYDIGDDSDD